jgi:hypothetical protein
MSLFCKFCKSRNLRDQYNDYSVKYDCMNCGKGDVVN